MSGLLNNYNGIVNAQANEFMAGQPRTNETRIVTNPRGLPLGKYLIHAEEGDSNNLDTIAQFALNLSTRDFWVRTAVAYPSTWSAWAQINVGGAGAVTSWSGILGPPRVGNVVAANGDYTASMITNVPSGNMPAADVNVQLALDYLQAYAPPPAAIGALAAGPIFLPPSSGWVTVDCPYVAAISREQPPLAPVWAIAPPVGGASGVELLVAPPGTNHLISMSAIIGVMGPSDADFGVRICRTNALIPICQNQDGPDGDVNQNYNTASLFVSPSPDTYYLQINNFSTTIILTVGAASMTFLYQGPMP